MILYRHVPADSHVVIGCPFIWESSEQPAGRWHGEGEGPVHYFADTPDGAWAEFLRHAEIDDPDELQYLNRAIWVIQIELDPEKITNIGPIDISLLTGGKETYPKCRAIARAIRKQGTIAIDVPSAALRRGGAHGWKVKDGLQPGPPRDARVIVVFEPIPNAVGWLIGNCSAPPYIHQIYVPLVGQ